MSGDPYEATTEVAKTAGKGIDAAREFGRFLVPFIRRPLEQAMGIVEDRLAYARWERQQRLMLRAREFMNEAGLEGPTRPIPLNIAVPLLQAGSLEEDDELQDMWARLLVNAADADSGVDMGRAFISILEDFGPMEARLLDMIVNAPPEAIEHNAIYTGNLPESYFQPASAVKLDTPPPPPPHIQVALWNLIRLGCLVSQAAWSGSESSIRYVEATTLGRELVKACTLDGVMNCSSGAS